jgi:guanylate kinase
MKGRLFILSGPSGVGKDTVIRKLREDHFPLYFAVTATTREIRPDEKDGVDYFFLKPEEFKKLVAKDQLLEWINIYNDTFYGTPKKPILKALSDGHDVLLRIETQGADTIKQKMPEAIRIFLAPSSFEDLEHRLKKRRSESAEIHKIRLEKARHEMDKLPEFDYVVYNHDGELDKTVEEIKQIINKLTQ